MTLEQIKRFADKQGLYVLSKSYTKGKPLLLECPHHGNFFLKAYDLHRGCGCPWCGHYEPTRARRHSYEFVKKVINDKGYTLISKSYKNAQQKIDVQCPRHGIFTTTFSQLYNVNQKCPKCAHEDAHDRWAFSYDYVRKYVNGCGYELLNTSYINASQRLSMVCPKHGKFKMTLSHLRGGERCPKCSKEKFGLARRGANHPLWKGGTRQLMKSLRELLVTWRTSQFIRAGNRCEISGKKSKNLHVHHMTSFATIVKITFDEIGLPIKSSASEYTSQEWERIQSHFLANNDRLADPIVMDKNVHMKFHEFCGGTCKPTTHEQLESFKLQMGYST